MGGHRRGRKRLRGRRTSGGTLSDGKGSGRMRHRAALSGAGRKNLCNGGSPFHLGGFPKHLGRLRLRGTADRKDSVPGLAAVRLWNGKLD